MTFWKSANTATATLVIASACRRQGLKGSRPASEPLTPVLVVENWLAEVAAIR